MTRDAITAEQIASLERQIATHLRLAGMHEDATKHHCQKIAELEQLSCRWGGCGNQVWIDAREVN
jgi:hypothetical protein